MDWPVAANFCQLWLSNCKQGMPMAGKPANMIVSGLVVIVLRFFSSCSKPICVAWGSPKIHFVFTRNILSKLFDPVDLTSHLIIIKIYLTGSLCFYGFHGQNQPKILQNLFHTILNNSINKKTALEKKNLRRSKVGGDSMFVFFKPSLSDASHDQLCSAIFSDASHCQPCSPIFSISRYFYPFQALFSLFKPFQ